MRTYISLMKANTKIIFTLLSLACFCASETSLADADFEGTHFSGSGQCTRCHDGLIDNEKKDISIVKDWSSSMMANSSRDPYWRAKVSSELKRAPNLSEEINETCSRCHTPMATYSAEKNDDPVKLFPVELLGENGFLNPANKYYDHALDGVSCTVCHQIADDGNLGTLDGFSGNYTIEEYNNPVDRPAFGQYASPVIRPMQNNVQFTPQPGDHTSSSEMCATCHNLKTPFVDASGNLASGDPESEFPEQMAYSEWDNSDYRSAGPLEQSCQDCHMPAVEGNVLIASNPNTLFPRPGFSKHSFLGANTTMMDILNQNREALEVTASDDDFKQAISNSRQFLQSAASLKIIKTEFIDSKLKVTLKITNHTGHKLPSAYPSRRVFIHFTLRDNNGKMLFESGKLNADGSIVGAATDKNSSTLEPHYEVIETADQVQIYEPIMQNTDGRITHTLLRAAAYKKDNRLTPVGFNKTAVPNDVAVKGAAREDADFNLGSDTIIYLVEVGETRDLSIFAELKYQTLSFGHLQDLFKDAEPPNAVPEVVYFKTLFESARIRSEKLASASLTLGEAETPSFLPATYLLLL